MEHLTESSSTDPQTVSILPSAQMAERGIEMQAIGSAPLGIEAVELVPHEGLQTPVRRASSMDFKAFSPSSAPTFSPSLSDSPPTSPTHSSWEETTSPRSLALDSKDARDHRGDRKRTDATGAVTLWKNRYFALAKICLERALSGGEPQEEHLKRFILYLGPSIYQLELQRNEHWMFQQLKKSRAESEYMLWTRIHDAIVKVPPVPRHSRSISTHHTQFSDSIQQVYDQWEKMCLELYQAQVLESTTQILSAAGYPLETIKQKIIRPQLRQYRQQLQEIRRNTEKHRIMQAFMATKDLSALEHSIKIERARLERVTGKEQGEFAKIQTEITEKMEQEVESFFSKQQKLLRETINRLCNNNKEHGEEEVVKWYRGGAPFSSAEKDLLAKKAAGKTLQGPEAAALSDLQERITTDFIVQLQECWKTSDLQQADICDEDGNTLLHHALERLMQADSTEQRAFLLKFVEALYEHGALPHMYNHKGEDIYTYSKIFSAEDSAFNTALGWQLMILHLQYVPVRSEVEKHAKDILSRYSIGMPAFLRKNAFIRWMKDYRRVRTSRRFEDIWEIGCALTQAAENLDDEPLMVKIQERKEQPRSEARRSLLFRKLDSVAVGAKTGKLLVATRSAEDRHAELLEQFAQAKDKLERQAAESEKRAKEREALLQQEATHQLQEKEQALRQEMLAQKAEMKAQMQAQRVEMEARIQAQEAEIQARLQAQEERLMRMFAQAIRTSPPREEPAAPISLSNPPLSSSLDVTTHLAPTPTFAAGLQQHGFLRPATSSLSTNSRRPTSPSETVSAIESASASSASTSSAAVMSLSLSSTSATE